MENNSRPIKRAKPFKLVSSPLEDFDSIAKAKKKSSLFKREAIEYHGGLHKWKEKE